MELKIEYLKISDLEPYAGNARKHEEADVSAIKKSIQEFGFSDPIGIWSDHNVIVEGHGRLQAAKELGMDTVPVIRLDHLTDEQRRAYALAHNKTAELSAWDFNVLDEELAGIEEIDMSVFGFDIVEDEGFGTDFELPDGDKPEFCQMTFTLHESQKELIENAIEQIGEDVSETYGNTNKNGNALFEVVKQWEELKMSK